MNWTVLIIFGVLALALVIFLVVRNQKDEKEFEEQANNDYHKTKDEENDTEIDEVTK
jgi:type II secretory pathway pseudopilin PulG